MEEVRRKERRGEEGRLAERGKEKGEGREKGIGLMGSDRKKLREEERE